MQWVLLGIGLIWGATAGLWGVSTGIAILLGCFCIVYGVLCLRGEGE